jgi:hypothetical protein
MVPEPHGDIHIDANSQIDVNSVIDLDGDRATGRAGWIFVVRGKGEAPMIDMIGDHEDEYVREFGSGVSSRSSPSSTWHVPPGRPDARAGRGPPGTALNSAPLRVPGAWPGLSEPPPTVPLSAAATTLGRCDAGMVPA